MNELERQIHIKWLNYHLNILLKGSYRICSSLNNLIDLWENLDASFYLFISFVWVFCSCSKQGYSFLQTQAFHHCGFSCGAQGLGTQASGVAADSVVVAYGLSCSHSIWNLPKPGIEPVSPALAGRFLSTVPPGKCKIWVYFNQINQQPTIQGCTGYLLLHKKWPLNLMA